VLAGAAQQMTSVAGQPSALCVLRCRAGQLLGHCCLLAAASSCGCRRDFVRDFLVGVVGRPAVLAGNSIGGFISASCAADFPTLVAGLALVNT
jgi:pimeloyl-ACP methyl ester carboxylesterase